MAKKKYIHTSFSFTGEEYPTTYVTDFKTGEIVEMYHFDPKGNKIQTYPEPA